VKPTDEIYMGQIVGEHCKDNDLEINLVINKKLSNVRAYGSDDAAKIKPMRQMSLESCLEYLSPTRWSRSPRTSSACASVTSRKTSASASTSKLAREGQFKPMTAIRYRVAVFICQRIAGRRAATFSYYFTTTFRGYFARSQIRRSSKASGCVSR
jgi:hypothetical protein